MPDHVRPLLVFFYTPSSGPARRMESLLAHLARKERERLRVKRVDVAEFPEIAERFKITRDPLGRAREGQACRRHGSTAARAPRGSSACSSRT